MPPPANLPQSARSDLSLVFDFETDPAALGLERLRRIGGLGMLVGVPSLLAGFAASFLLVTAFRVVNKLTLMPVMLGALLLANGVYRLGVGAAPVLSRSRALRLAFLFLILSALTAGLFAAYFRLFGAD